ncbi:MAG: hypothetical protein ACM3Y9_05770 [Ignavibacteria bacterium]
MNRIPQGSHYANDEAARRALALAAPMIEAARRDPQIVGSGFLFVVVMDPGLTPPDAAFEEAILLERGFGDEAAWDADYRRFARDKARSSWLNGADGRALQALVPHRLKRGDSLLAGGVCIDGITVAASGAFAWFDELAAGTVALALRALARAARESEARECRLE